MGKKKNNKGPKYGAQEDHIDSHRGENSVAEGSAAQPEKLETSDKT
jgi:hypothetical protein